MHLLPLRHQTPPRKRIRILPTKQRPNLPTPLRLHHLQSGTISIRPDQFLVEGRHEFPLVVQEDALVGDEDGGVPEAAKGGGGALVEADVREDFVLGAGLAEGGDFGAGD